MTTSPQQRPEMRPALRLEGASNFRDIGGHATMDGHRVKQGRIFRSGELSRLTDSDHDILRCLNVALVADLRSRKECELLPSRWPAGLNTVLYHADVSMDIRINGRSIIELIKEDPSADHVARVVEHGFHIIADSCGPALKLITDRLASGGGPLLFHCTNGRDRTGVISAMLLYMLGASRDAIVADFMITNQRLDVEQVVTNTIATFHKALGITMTRATAELVTLVKPEYINAMFIHFDTKYGSPESYLAHFGIYTALVEKLRQRLLEPAY